MIKYFYYKLVEALNNAVLASPAFYFLKGVLGKAKAKVSASIDKVGISMDAKKK